MGKYGLQKLHADRQSRKNNYTREKKLVHAAYTRSTRGHSTEQVGLTPPVCNSTSSPCGLQQPGIDVQIHARPEHQGRMCKPRPGKAHGSLNGPWIQIGAEATKKVHADNTRPGDLEASVVPWAPSSNLITTHAPYIKTSVHITLTSCPAANSDH